jgi:hypothetical protein
MHDKVLSMIRETLLHENSVELFAYDFDRSIARLDLSQARENDEYPDYNLSLTFTGVTEFSGALTDSQATELLGIECHRRPDGYYARISVGLAGGPPTKTVHLVFGDLSYKRE